MNMVGYRLMQKYGLLSLSHDVTKRIVFCRIGCGSRARKPFGYVSEMFSQYVFLQCCSCTASTLIFSTRAKK